MRGDERTEAGKSRPAARQPAYRRILDTLRVTSPSIGGPVDICRITADKAAALSEKDIERVRKQAQRWSELESKALDDLFT